MAQWKRAGPITQRSVDRNHALLKTFFISSNVLKVVLIFFEMYIHVYFQENFGKLCPFVDPVLKRIQPREAGKVNYWKQNLLRKCI